MARPAPPLPVCRTLLVTGERSWLPVEVEPLTHVERVTVAGGHSVLWDDFEATAEALRSFVRRTA